MKKVMSIFCAVAAITSSQSVLAATEDCRIDIQGSLTYKTASPSNPADTTITVVIAKEIAGVSGSDLVTVTRETVFSVPEARGENGPSLSATSMIQATKATALKTLNLSDVNGQVEFLVPSRDGRKSLKAKLTYKSLSERNGSYVDAQDSALTIEGDSFNNNNVVSVQIGSACLVK